MMTAKHSSGWQTKWPAIALALIVALAASRLWLLPLYFSPDPNEGWNAFQAVRATGVGPLYPPADALTGNNYPPLSFLIVGAFGGMIGDQIIAGRLIALASVVGIAGLIALIVRRLGAAPGQAMGGALLFLLLNVTLLRAYLALDDPQWLGHLLMTAALPLLLPLGVGEAPRRGRVAAAALLMIAGGLVKQNLVAWPIAVTLWLGLHHRRALGVWLITALAAGAMALAACWVAYGPGMLLDIIGTPRDYSLARMAWRSLSAVAVIVPLLWWVWPLASAQRRESQIDLILIAILIAVPLGIVQRSGAGVDINASFEAFIALSIAAALALPPRVDRSAGARRVAAIALALLILVGGVKQAREIAAFPRRAAAWAAMEQHIAAIPGPVACEIQALCYWAGKDFELDYFLYSQRALKRGEAPVLDRILAARRWSGAMLGPDGSYNHDERRRDPVISRLTQAMRPIFIDSEGRRLLVPRQ